MNQLLNLENYVNSPWKIFFLLLCNTPQLYPRENERDDTEKIPETEATKSADTDPEIQNGDCEEQQGSGSRV